MTWEIKVILMTRSSNKAFMFDEFNGKLFKTAWNIIGEDFTNVSRYFFTSGETSQPKPHIHCISP